MRSDYIDVLEAVSKALSAKPMTARELADMLGCTKPTAYNYLEALEARGFKLSAKLVRIHGTGPLAKAYKVAKKGKLQIPPKDQQH